MAKYSKTPKQQAAIAIAKKKTKVKALSVAEQNERIFEAGFDLVRSANDKFSGSRTITRRAAKSVMSRCLSKNEDQTY
jgi:hypothetical protein